MKLVLDCCIFSSGKIYLAMRHSRAVTARAAGADGKEVPTREVFLQFCGYVGGHSLVICVYIVSSFGTCWLEYRELNHHMHAAWPAQTHSLCRNLNLHSMRSATFLMAQRLTGAGTTLAPLPTAHFPASFVTSRKRVRPLPPLVAVAALLLLLLAPPSAWRSS